MEWQSCAFAGSEQSRKPDPPAMTVCRAASRGHHTVTVMCFPFCMNEVGSLSTIHDTWYWMEEPVAVSSTFWDWIVLTVVALLMVVEKLSQQRDVQASSASVVGTVCRRSSLSMPRFIASSF